MRKFVFFYLNTCFSLVLSSQSTNTALHSSYKIIPTNMVNIHSKSYYMETSNSSSYLVGMDNTGQTIFKTLLPTGNLGGIAVKLVRTSDKKLLSITHQVGGCDYLPTPQTIVTRCDTIGTIDFSISLQRQIRDITEHPDGTYYMVHSYDPNFATSNPGPTILHYSSSGASMTPVANTFTVVHSILALPNGNLLISGIENGVLKHAEITTSGTVINAVNAPFQIKSFNVSTGGTLYALTASGSLQSYSANLTPLNNSFAAVLPNIKITDFTLRNDSVFCTGYDTVNSSPYYGLLGNNLNLLYQTLAPYKRTFPTGISVTNSNRINIVAYGHSNTNTQGKYLNLYQTSPTGSLVSKYNAGVTGYSVLSSTFLGMNFMYFTYQGSVQLSVQVKNFGTDTITDFYLNYDGSINCPQPYHQKFNVRIPPNSVVTVTTDVFTVPLTFSTFNGTSITYNCNLCISSSVPNSENDTATDNDSWCQVLVFQPVGINELIPVDNTVRLFPNPTQNYLNVEAEHNIRKIEIIGVAGELLHAEYPEKKDLHINAAHWPPGIYFLKTETEKGSYVKKLIKN